MARNALFAPMEIRDLTLKNRTVVSPMCQYSSDDGFFHDWQLIHLGQFAMGGFGLVFTEATAVEKRGRITWGDTGIWSDDHIAPIKPIVQAVQARGSAIGIQLAPAAQSKFRVRDRIPWEIDNVIQAHIAIMPNSK